jgi:hypothetical protein
MGEEKDGQHQAFNDMLWKTILYEAGLSTNPVGSSLFEINTIWIWDNVNASDYRSNPKWIKSKMNNTTAGVRSLRDHLKDATFSHLEVEYCFVTE